MINHREDEEAAPKTHHGEEKGEAEREKRCSKRDVMTIEGTEEEQVKTDSGLEVEMHMEDMETEKNKELISGQEEEETKDLEEKDEQKRNRKKRAKKQIERGRNRRGVKDVSERVEEEKKSQTHEVSAVSSEESSTLSEPPFELMNSCDLSDPIYLGCGGTGAYCPSVPIPLLYSAPRPVPVPVPVQTQPVPPQLHGTKRPHSPLLPHSLPPQGPQPLEVRTEEGR